VDASDLAREVQSMISRGYTRASYVVADYAREQNGARQVLFVGLVNGGVEDRHPSEREDVLTRIGRAAVVWLRTRSLLAPGTLISISLSREVDLWFVSWSRGRGGRAYWVDAAGELTERRPADDPV
jgi:hypothetical protein